MLVKTRLGIKVTGIWGEDLSENNFLKTLQRELKKVNVDPKQILRKDSLISKAKKKKAQKTRKKVMERFGET